MLNVKIPEKLKHARRSFEFLDNVTILNDFRFDKKLNIWYIHISIKISMESVYIPQISNWYITVEPNYPNGEINVYPDVNDSIKVTFQHQLYNGNIEKNGLWRKGKLCVENDYLSKINDIIYPKDERLFINLFNTINWLEAAASNSLISVDDLFELPDFDIQKASRFIYSENMDSYSMWKLKKTKSGIADLYLIRKHGIYLVRAFKSSDEKHVINYVEWGDYLSKHYVFENHDKAIWLILNELPIINVWQAPLNFGELSFICDQQGIDLLEIIRKNVKKIRGRRRHLLLVGFPIPEHFGDNPTIMHWQALILPEFSYGNKYFPGFRADENGWWMRDKSEVLKETMKLEWIKSDNWESSNISQRGRLSMEFIKKRILLIGAGCLGSSIAEILVRAGVNKITVMDHDIFTVGNLSRHVLNMDDIGKVKECALCNHLNKLNPHATIKSISKRLEWDDGTLNVNIDDFDLVIDTTGENEVLDILQKGKLKREIYFASFSVGFGAKHLYIYLCKGKEFSFKTFSSLIKPYIEFEEQQILDMDLPKDGIGCWNPTFPARSDDIWLASSISVKTLDKFINQQKKVSLSMIYEQKISEEEFDGFIKIDER